MKGYKIYFLLKNGTIIYIGHTIHIRFRMIGHHVKDYDCIRWMDCRDKEAALYYEKRWQQRFKPALNKNGIKTGSVRPYIKRKIKA